LNGGFYSRQGMATALAGCERLLEPRSRLEQLLEAFPALRSAVSAPEPSRKPAPLIVPAAADEAASIC
jgi:hypothetical protein